MERNHRKCELRLEEDNTAVALRRATTSQRINVCSYQHLYTFTGVKDLIPDFLSEGVLSFRKGALVLTSNPCPEYIISLDAEALFFLANNPANNTRDLIAKCLSAAMKNTPLTKTEQMTLKFICVGYTNVQIARRRRVHPGSVRNTISQIYEKLNTSSRIQTHLYFWGQWPHLLRRGWIPPLHVLPVIEALNLGHFYTLRADE